MRIRLCLAALLGAGLVLTAGCDDDAPPGRRPDPPGAMPAPVEPDDTGTDTLLIPFGDSTAPGAPAVQPGDEAVPPPVSIRGTVGSCDLRATEGMCYAFSGLGWTTEAAQAECSGAPGGVFQSAPCPTEARIGECVYRPGGDAAREIVTTFYAPMDPLVAEGVCRGTFRAF